VIGIKKKPETGQKKTCYTTDNFFGVASELAEKFPKILLNNFAKPSHNFLVLFLIHPSFSS
jgi:hypothetical protein